MVAFMDKGFLSSKILIVDDMKFNILTLESFLQSEGYTNIFKAMTGKEALKLIDEIRPNIVLLDIFLPDIDGTKICEKIRSNPANQNIRIIMQSSQTHPEQKKIAFDLGANDFINKPFEPTELLSRVKIQLDQYILYDKLLETSQRLNEELDQAKDLLTDLLPPEEVIDDIERKSKVSISTFYKSSSELGGDFYNFYNLEENGFLVYLWDFSGHGIKASINTFRLHSLINSKIGIHSSQLSEFLKSVSNLVYHISSASNYATMVCCKYNPKEKILGYSSAACPAPILLSFKNGKFLKLESPGFPIGVVTDAKYVEHKIDVSEWDVLILYSDALIESKNKKDKFISIDEYAEFVLSNKNSLKYLDSKSILDLLLKKLNKECGSDLGDDLTLIVIFFEK